MGNTESRVVSDDLEIKKFSHFNPGDVKEWSSFFRSTYPSNLMSQNDLKGLFESLFPLGKVEGFSNRLFTTINIGQTGFIDFNELLIAFSILQKGSNFERLRWIFRFYDQDKDGVVSKTEMQEGIEDLLKMIRNTLDIQVNSQECVNEIFQSVENQSGFLTFNDFERLSELKGSCFKIFHLISD